MVWGLDLATIRVLGLALFMVLIVVLPGPQSRRHSRLFSSESQQGRLRGLVRRWIGVLEFAVEFGVARGGTREALELVGTHGQRREQLAVLGARVLQVEVETVLGGQGYLLLKFQVVAVGAGGLRSMPSSMASTQSTATE